MLHLQKLAVGAADVATLRRWQRERRAADPPLRHRTRHFPRRADEILAGGSLYWIVAGTLCVRQRVRDIVVAQREDGSACADIVLDTKLVRVRPRPVRAFQGWRYLAAADAPPDLGRGGEADLPEALRLELARAGLL